MATSHNRVILISENKIYFGGFYLLCLRTLFWTW